MKCLCFVTTKLNSSITISQLKKVFLMKPIRELFSVHCTISFLIVQNSYVKKAKNRYVKNFFFEIYL